MSTSANTVNVIDPRIEPQPAPVYVKNTGPVQNQYYKIPASGLSDSFVTFNNLTTLGTDRAYLDTFELEVTAQIQFTVNAIQGASSRGVRDNDWTFESFPFNKCCEEIRVNVNGGAFFSQPLSYLRAKERYWNDQLLADAYANVCPVEKAHLANEYGAVMTTDSQPNVTTCKSTLYPVTASFDSTSSTVSLAPGAAVPTRMAYGSLYYMQSANGITGGNNVLRGNTNTSSTTTITTSRVWREPIFCSPFSSRLDSNFGRPLYNITSLDLAFNLQNLGNMIRIITTDDTDYIVSYEIHLTAVQLCYQVATIPPSMSAPPATIVPYRRFVPYITDYPGNANLSNSAATLTLTSGVYTLNEVPTAIWVFVGPTKNLIQTNPPDGVTASSRMNRSWATNKTFGTIEHVSISMANTTQILNTAEKLDLYRIAKTNGCQDSWMSWANTLLPRQGGKGSELPGGVLRLIPGQDIVLPEQELIPGANANNMVFQIEVSSRIPNRGTSYIPVALWILFEYVGVAAITPGQCEISMNPLGNGAGMASAPTISGTGELTEGQVDGSGFLDKIRKGIGAVVNAGKKGLQFVKDNQLLSKGLGMASNIAGMFNPAVGQGLSTAAGVSGALGFGSSGVKRGRYEDDIEGGAIMGLGDFI